MVAREVIQDLETAASPGGDGYEVALSQGVANESNRHLASPQRTGRGRELLIYKQEELPWRFRLKRDRHLSEMGRRGRRDRQVDIHRLERDDWTLPAAVLDFEVFRGQAAHGLAVLIRDEDRYGHESHVGPENPSSPW